MSEHDIDKLMEVGLGAEAASDAFRERLLRDSTAAFVRGRAFRKRLRAAGLAAAVLLVAATAFACGRFSAGETTAAEQQLARADHEKDDAMTVPVELVAWLDAARFFSQLGMDKRATRAYEQASELIPHDSPQLHEAGFNQKNAFAAIIEDCPSIYNSADEMPGRSDSGKNQRRSQCLEAQSEISTKIIAQYFGG